MLLVEIECAVHSSSCWNWDDEICIKKDAECAMNFGTLMHYMLLHRVSTGGWDLNEHAMYKVHMVAECAGQAECAIHAE